MLTGSAKVAGKPRPLVIPTAVLTLIATVSFHVIDTDPPDRSPLEVSLS
jgi:hypothetical protein